MAKPMCQSCGMPLNKKNNGTEKDGSLSPMYCNLCYANGSFVEPNITVDQMQEKAYQALKELHWPGFLAKIATKNIPKLSRWDVSQVK